MGYQTDLYGEFTLDKPLTPEHKAYLEAFNASRRMKRNATITETFSDPVRLAAGLPIGKDGGYYVGSSGSDHGQVRSADIIDYNRAPDGQPGLWCQWVPGEAGATIEWDGGEKFYDYVDWIKYIVEHFLAPWGYSLSGEIEWNGDDSDDRGTIYAKDNQIEAVASEITNVGPSWGKK